jgi:hypothetical protein
MLGSRPLPYVYRLVHKPTGRFYFGHRRKNVQLGIKSENDLWVIYFSSCKQVRGSNLQEYEPTILAEFFEPVDSLIFEQELIKKHWGDPLLINRARIYGEKYDKWIQSAKGCKHSEETKKKMSIARTGMKRSEEYCRKRSIMMKGKAQVRSEEAKLRYRECRANTPWTKKALENLSIAQNKRFKRDDQRESNRRASMIGWSTGSHKVMTLKVCYPDGQVRLFSKAKEFVDLVRLNKKTIYRHATKHSGRKVQSGPLKDFIFSWVERNMGADSETWQKYLFYDSQESSHVTRGTTETA